MFDTAIQLGGNSAETLNLFQSVLEWLRNRGEILKGSSLYVTAPWGFESERSFLNAVVVWRSGTSPEILLRELIRLECELGRKRSADSSVYQDRSIDLDILLSNDLVMATDELNLPHPRMADRRFVLEPLNEILPDWRHPVNTKTIEQLLAECPDRTYVEKIKEWNNWTGNI